MVLKWKLKKTLHGSGVRVSREQRVGNTEGLTFAIDILVGTLAAVDGVEPLGA